MPTSALVEALLDIQSTVGDVVAPRIRAIARGDDGCERARDALLVHLRGREVAGELATLDPGSADARALAAALGVSLRGAPAGERIPADERRTIKLMVRLTPAERARLDELRGDEDASEYMARRAGLREGG